MQNDSYTKVKRLNWIHSSIRSSQEKAKKKAPTNFWAAERDRLSSVSSVEIGEWGQGSLTDSDEGRQRF